jgi:hypothetical protein
MRPLERPLLALLLAASPLAAVDSPSVSQWLVTSGRATGAHGEQFVTSLRIVNDTAAAATVDVTYYPRVNFDKPSASASGDNTFAAMTTAVTVSARRTYAIDDVLGTLFGITSTTASGALRVESRNGIPLSVLSETLVVNARGLDPQGTPVSGTYGFAIPGQLVENAIAVGDVGYVPYLAGSSTTTQGYRSNLFLFAANGDGNTVVNVKLLRGADGTTAGSRDVTLGKWVQTQINDIAGWFVPAEANTNFTAILTVKSGGPVFTGASVNDNGTGSQVYAPPTKKWAPRNSSFGLLLGDLGFGFSARLDIRPDGLADFLAAPIAIPACPPDANVYLLYGGNTGTLTNTTFTLLADGSTSFAGGDTAATWSGSFAYNADGSLQGQLTYTRQSGSAGSPCPGGTSTMPFVGRRILAYGIY